MLLKIRVNHRLLLLVDRLISKDHNWYPENCRQWLYGSVLRRFFGCLSESSVTSHRLFRAHGRHVQFRVIWTFPCQVTSINQAFPVHKNFQLFCCFIWEPSDILWWHVQFWNMARRGCQMWHKGRHLCAAQVSWFANTEETLSHDGHNAFVEWNAICVSDAFIFSKIFINFYFYVI